MIDKTYQNKDLAQVRAKLAKTKLNIDVQIGKTKRQLMRKIVKSKNPNFDERIIDILLTPRHG